MFGAIRRSYNDKKYATNPPGRKLMSPHLALRRARGISLVELLIAIFVVAVGVLGTVSALWYGIRSEKYSERRANAVFQGRELLNAIRAQNLPFGSSDVTGTPYLQLGSELNDGDYDDDSDDGAVRREFNDAPFGNIYPTNQYNFKRSVEMKRLSNDPNDYRFEMVAIKVSLYWNEGRHDKEVTLWGYTKRSGS